MKNLLILGAVCLLSMPALADNNSGTQSQSQQQTALGGAPEPEQTAQHGGAAAVYQGGERIQ